LQSIAHSILAQYNFPKAIPRVLDIVKHPSLGVALVLEKQPGARLFSDYLKTHVKWGSPCKSNDTLFLSVLAQIATYLAILEATIGMNHRDLTGTNVLMVAPTIPVHQSVTLGSNTWILHYTHQTILIDFGFACIGTSDGKQTVSAGEFLPTADFCPKQGRDLFLFLSSVWDVELFRSSLTEPVKQLFHKWLHDKTSMNWSSWLKTSFDDNMMSMYLLTNAEQFQSPSCRPMKVLKDIETVNSKIVSFK
jgi:serine/threonine protein kinase